MNLSDKWSELKFQLYSAKDYIIPTSWEKAIATTLLAATTAFTGTATACDYLQPDKNPPVIQNYTIAEGAGWVVDGEKIGLEADAYDDRGVQQVYIQVDNGSPMNLIKVPEKTESEKTGEKSSWIEDNLKLPPGDHSFTIIAEDKAGNKSAPKEGKISVYPNYGISSRDEIKYGLDPSKQHPVARYLLDKNLSIYLPKLEILDNDQTLDQNKKAFIDLLPTMDKTFADWVVENQFTFKDGEISDLELALLRNPANQAYIQQLFNQYISDTNKINPELATELKKLPDLENVEVNEIKKLEGLEEILVLAGNPKYTTAFDSMLNEGIKDKRKLCTPVEALYSIACDKEFDENNNPLQNLSLENLMDQVWRKGLDTYRPDIWENFDEATKRLNSPNLVERYLQDNYSYSYVRGEAEGVKSAEQIFKDKKGACYDHALLGGYCLKKNGYEKVQGMVVNFDRLVMGYFIGHVVCLYQYPNDSLYYALDLNSAGGTRVYGPYQSIDDAGEAACKRESFGEANLNGYSLHEIDLQTGKYKTTL
jgi:hypothetical protein